MKSLAAYTDDRASSVENLKKRALDLPEEDRAYLASSLLDSLPGILSDLDDGIAEALRRDAELETRREHAIPFGQLDTAIRNRRR